MRALVAYFKVADHRVVHSRHLKQLKEDDLVPKLASFTASFAKWRLETIATVLEALCNIKDVVRRFFDKKLYGKVQKPGELEEVSQCVKDDRFWAYISVLRPIATMLD